MQQSLHGQYSAHPVRRERSFTAGGHANVRASALTTQRRRQPEASARPQRNTRSCQWQLTSPSICRDRCMQTSASAIAVTTESDVPARPSPALEFIAFLQDLPWSRLATWASVAAVAAQLSDFFGIAMGTFIVAFIGNGFVRSAHDTGLLSRRLSDTSRRRLLVLMYFTMIVSVLTLFGVLTIPDIIRESSDFVQRLKSENVWVVVLEKLRHGVGDGLMEQLERLLLVASGAELSPENVLTHAWTTERTAQLGAVLQRMLRGCTEGAVGVTTGLVTSTSRFALQVGVSMILAFMILWDLPNIRRGVASLETSRLSAVYKEVAPTFGVFGTLFGKALQAQARIAAVNTALTAAGMYAMAIPGLGLLSLFVFICSFIPIAGVFFSTVPIAFVALTEYGFIKLALTIGLVTGIHFIEAYLLNPAIYSAHLKLHPLIVLTVLVVAEHSLGVWGLLLAVPSTVFFLDYMVRYPACSVTDVAAKELEKVSLSEQEYLSVNSSGGRQEAESADGRGSATVLKAEVEEHLSGLA